MSIELASSAVALLTPYLKDAGTEAAKSLGKESANAALKLLGWLRGKLTGHARETLTDFEDTPDNQLNQDALRIELAKLLEKQPALIRDLQELLPSVPVREVTMTQVVGAGAAAGQISGNQNSITMRK